MANTTTSGLIINAKTKYLINMRTLYHNRSNYYGITEKVEALPHFIQNIAPLFGAFQTLQSAAKVNQSSPTAGKLWQGTPISDFLVGKAHASEPVSGGTQSGVRTTLGVTDAQAADQRAFQDFVNSGGNTSTNTGGGSNNTGSIRDQMLKGLIPWDDNLLNAGNANEEAARREQEARNAIESGYSGYFSQLDSILNQGLPTQRAEQENIANSQFNQGVDRLGFQKTQGINDLTAETAKTQSAQTRTLKDLSENIRNSFNAGNVYLGARGAGDSSAANQYAYALTKLGSQQRGDVNSQFTDIYGDINSRMTKLGDVYNQAVNDLTYERDQKISGIASWFAEQQNALRQAQAQGQLSKGQDLASLSQNLLNVALQQLQTVQAESSNRRSALEQWAMNNSQNIQQLQGNMGAIASAPFAQAPSAQPIVGTPQVTQSGGLFAPTGFGGGSSETDIFGRPLRA